MWLGAPVGTAMSRPGAAFRTDQRAGHAGAPRGRLRGDLLRAGRHGALRRVRRHHHRPGLDPGRRHGRRPRPRRRARLDRPGLGRRRGRVRRAPGALRLPLRPGPARRDVLRRRCTTPSASARPPYDGVLPRAWFEALDAVAGRPRARERGRGPARRRARPGAGRVLPRLVPGEAQALGVRGWVSNAADGTVRAHLEGEAEAVERWWRGCSRARRTRRVERVDVRDVPPAGAAGFEVR